MATKKFLDINGLSAYSKKVKAYVDDKVSALDLELYVIVTDGKLPSTGINKNKIYLVPAGVTGNQNKYAEYVYTGDTSATYNENNWEKLGEMQTSITVDKAVTAGSNNPVSGGAVSTALGKKVEKVDGKQLSTNDYTTAEKTKLAGIAEGANNYTLPTASANAKGGITLGYTANGKNYPVALDASGKAYVSVPWTDTNTTYDLTPYAKTADVDSALAKKVNTSDYTTKMTALDSKNTAQDTAIAGKLDKTAVATSAALGLVKIGHTADGAELPVVLDKDSKAYVSVEVMTDDDITSAFDNAQ